MNVIEKMLTIDEHIMYSTLLVGSCKCGGLNAKGCDQNGFCTSMETQVNTENNLE